MRRLGAIPAIVALAVIAVGAAQLISGGVGTGVSTDEPTHVARAQGWLSTGWYVPEANLVDGEPNPGDESSIPFVYGPAYSSVAHLANVELGNEPIADVALTTEAYSVRHLVVAALALLAAAAAGLAVGFITGSWRFGLWTAAALLAIPSWLGHGQFNPKDVPGGTGYTLATVSLVLALGPGPPSRRRLAAVVALLAGGIFIGVGTRLALWAPIFASVVVYAALRVGQRLRGRTAPEPSRDVAVLAGGALGWAAVFAAYPKVLETPWTLLTQSISASADFQNETVTLTAGRLLSDHPPWWYLPTWIAAGLPVLIGAFAVAGAGVAVLALTRLRGRRAPSPGWSAKGLALTLVLLQALLLPVLVVLGDATLYDAARQHLYVFPALAILAGVGAEHLWRLAQRGGTSPAWPAATAVALSVALIVPMTEQLLLSPYNYTYVNPIAGLGGVNGRWETDYWNTSRREALSHVPRGVRLRCAASLPRESEPERETAFVECSDQPFDDERGRDATREPPDGEVWVISQIRGGTLPPAWCEEADNVTRRLRGEEVVMAYVLRCDPKRVRENEY